MANHDEERYNLMPETVRGPIVTTPTPPMPSKKKKRSKAEDEDKRAKEEFIHRA